jgi:hypothetical protein
MIDVLPFNKLDEAIEGHRLQIVQAGMGTHKSTGALTGIGCGGEMTPCLPGFEIFACTL